MRGNVRKALALAVVATVAGRAGMLFAQDARKPVPAARPAAKAQAAPAPAAAQFNPNDPRMKKLLAEWEKESARLKSLDVKIDRVDKSPAWGNEEFRGRALLESPNHAWLNFEKKVDENAQCKPGFVPHERIVCTGDEVWQYMPKTNQIFIFPLDKKNKKSALEEGPLPFLFNMKAAEAEARYLMALNNEYKDVYVISVVPRLKVDQEAFSKAFIQLVKKTFLPDRILLVSPDGNSTKDFKLADMKPNAPISPANFKVKDPGPPWQIVRDPGGDVAGEPAAANRQQPPAPAAAQPRRAAVAPRRAPVN